MQTPNPTPPQNGDWKCSKCVGIVFAKKSQCKCGGLKTDTNFTYTNLPKKGDWKCHNCDGVVYSHKLLCKCGNGRYTKSADYLTLTDELDASIRVCVSCNNKWQNGHNKCLVCQTGYCPP